MMLFAAYIFLNIFVGWTVISFLNVKEELALTNRLAVSFALGMGIVSMQLFLMFSIIGCFKIWHIFAPWVIIFIIRAIIIPDRICIKQSGGYSTFEKLLLAAISFVTIYLVFRAFIYPMESYDSVGIWALKAKAIYISGGMPLTLLKNYAYVTAHPDYPLLVPLQESLFYFISRGFYDSTVKLIFPAYFLALLIVFYHSLAAFLPRVRALIFTLLLAMIPHLDRFATNGYADIVMAFYFCSGLFFSYLWLKERKDGYLIISALMSGIGAWVKNEGLFLCFISMIMTFAALAFSNDGNKEKKINGYVKIVIFYAVAILIFILPWESFKSAFDLKNDLIKRDTLSVARAVGNLTRIGPILYEYQKQIFGFKKWSIVWIVFFFFFITNIKSVFSPRIILITGSIVAAYLLYTAVYIVTPLDYIWQLRTSASRLLLHIVPLAVFWTAIILKERNIDI